MKSGIRKVLGVSGLVSIVSAASACNSADFSIMTYNVGGLPAQFSSIDPEHNMPFISEKLNDYELVLVQEDFAYHDLLVGEATHPYISSKPVPGKMGDGLTSFSYFPFDDGKVTRRGWLACNGVFEQCNDCLAPKGFAVAEYEVSPGLSVLIYNIHMDAGDSEGDRAARAKQIDQLAADIEQRATYRAIIVAGDTNMGLEDYHEFDRLMALTGLRDSCLTLDCPQPFLLDKVLYRSSIWITIEPTQWRLATTFYNPEDEPLSDHVPVIVDFHIEPAYTKGYTSQNPW